MQGDGFQQSENAADPHGPQSPLAALVVAGLFATSFALGALGTHLLLTGKWVPFQEVSAPPLDVASDAASRAVPSKDAGELEVADRGCRARCAAAACLTKRFAAPGVGAHEYPAR